MSGWEAIIAGAIGAASAYQSSKAAKKKNEAVHDEWERRMQYEEEKAARKRNSIGGRAAPYIAEQMLRLYGEKSAGRGGFTLPIDEMLANMNIKERQSGSYNGGSYRADPYSSKGRKPDFTVKEARQLGIKTIVGRADPEAEGYNGKTWASRGGSYGLEGAASGGYNPWGVSAGEVGGDREQTRGMGNTKTQTERGYTSLYRPGPNGVVDSTVEQIPNIEGELATGGTGLFEERDIPIPPDIVKKIGASGLKAGASMLIPHVGLITNIAGVFYRRFGKSDGKEGFFEKVTGVKDADHGRWTKSGGFLDRVLGKLDDGPQQAQAPRLPVGSEIYSSLYS